MALAKQLGIRTEFRRIGVAFDTKYLIAGREGRRATRGSLADLEVATIWKNDGSRYRPIWTVQTDISRIGFQNASGGYWIAEPVNTEAMHHKASPWD